jgi:penicillin-binding protein 1C
VFALDPDIPPAAQRLRFEGEPGVWRLDGRRVAVGDRGWLPTPGRHELLLSAADGSVHRVRFEVRGPSRIAALPAR